MKQAKQKLLSAMGIFGTVGIFVKYIPMSSAAIALCRGLLGALFLLCIMFVCGKRFNGTAIRKNFLILFLSGAAMGFNWILLFESYNYTTVATATVCYYLAPLFLILASPLLAERMTVKKAVCVGIALVGLVFVSGMVEDGLPEISELKGIGLGIGAALLYATVMLLNKKLSPIPAYDKTIVQLSTSVIVILPYLLLTQGLMFPQLTAVQWGLLLVVGFVHTGVAYALYFGALKDLKAQTIAIFSYLDPVIAVVLSAVVLHEKIGPWGIAGTVLILGSALISELP